VVRHFAVNLTDADESDLQRRADSDVIPRPATGESKARIVKPLWPYLCIAVLLLLSLEWLVWCGGGRRA
jgi:hypothetical protein